MDNHATSPIFIIQLFDSRTLSAVYQLYYGCKVQIQQYSSYIRVLIEIESLSNRTRSPWYSYITKAMDEKSFF